MAIILVNNFSVVLARKLLRITAVAKATGISRTTLTNLYYRRSKNISFDVLEKLCRFLDCSASDLFEFEPLYENDINEPDPEAAPNRKGY